MPKFLVQPHLPAELGYYENAAYWICRACLCKRIQKPEQNINSHKIESAPNTQSVQMSARRHQPKLESINQPTSSGSCWTSARPQLGQSSWSCTSTSPLHFPTRKT